MPRPFRLCAPRDLCIEFRSCRVARVQVGDRGPYVLQAALAACHARARRAADTDWPRIAALYVPLRVVAPSPVIDLNRAIAHSMAFGPEAGLRLRLSVPCRSTGRGAFRMQGCGLAYPQRAGKGLSPRTGGRLRLPALNPARRRCLPGYSLR